MKHFFVLMSSCACALAIVVAGCSKTASVEGVVKTSGVVTWQGAPVAGASVTFYPDGAGGQAAAGTTDAQGKYELTTLNAKDGAKPGTYKVMISKMEASGPGATMSQEEQTKYLEQHGSPPPTEVKNILPQQYAEVTTTPLTATVKDGGVNEINFELQGAAGGTAASGAAAAAGGAAATGGHAIPPPGGTPPPP